MTSIRQTIPNYNGGISQQPDELKLPGQVVQAKNVYPDLVQGLMKRPGSKLIASLSDNGTAALNSEVNGRWFHYYRDEAEQYIGQVHRDGDINVWKCSDGSAQTVNFDAGTSTALANYLTHTADHDIQALTLNDYTYFVNRTKTAAMSTVKSPVKPFEAFIELKQIKYSSQYALEFYNNTTTTAITTATRLNISYATSDSGSNAAVHTAGTCDSIGTQTFGATETDETGKTNLYFRVTATGQPVNPGGSADSTYKCRYQVKCDLLYGGEGWGTGNTCDVTMTTPVHDTNYTVTVAESSTSNVLANLALVRPTPTPFDGNTAVTADSILGEIRQSIVGHASNNTGNGFTIEQIGTGLYVTRTDAAFNVSTPNPELMNVLTDSVMTDADLPKQCKHGYVVKVKNSDAQEDDYYVKFIGNNNRDGEGVWEECPEPNRNIDFDDGTLPIQMVREANGTFTVKQIDWSQCLVGDDTTAPLPSFIGKKINKMLFYRNRLVLLSDENIIMSQPGDFFNFWPKSAITYTNDDNIDISCSSTFPAIVYDGIPTNSGLVLFTKNQQFLLSTDSDVLSPVTAKVNALATYNFNYKTSPVSLGTTVGFLDNAGKYTRFWEVARVEREGEPVVVDQTKVVNKLFDKDVEKISNSRENSVIFFSKKNSATLYGYKYFNSGERRTQSSWFTWELSGTIQHHAVLDDALYVVVRNHDKDSLQRFSLKTDDEGHFIEDDKGTTTDTTDDFLYSIHLDNASPVASSSLSAYDAANNRTTFNLPAGFHQTGVAGTYVRSATTITVTKTAHGLNVDDSIHLVFTSGGATSNTYTVKTVADANTFTVTDTATGTINTSNVKINYGKLAVIAVPSATDTTFQGRTEDVKVFDSGGTTKVSLTGNWKTYDPDYIDDGNTGDDVTPSNDIIIGYQFDMEVQFPTIYQTQTSGNNTRSDTRSSLIVHRLKLSLGPSGMYTTTVERVGKPDYSETWEPPLADLYGANRVQFNEEIDQTIPIYERNKNLTVKLKSTHPSPATLYSMSWEGDITNRFYKGV